MSLPIIRKETLFSLEGKNISLTDLRGSSFVGLNILSVEVFDGRVHNTKVVVEVDSWKIQDKSQWKTERFVKRACLYNRLDLKDIVDEDLEIPIKSLEIALAFFKSRGYDFTEDDLYVDDFTIYAKPTSLGYFGGLENNPYYNRPRLITENRKYLITANDSKRISIKENGNES